jgi:hypothetical protein
MKTSLESGSKERQAVLDLYLFIPSSFQASRWSKTELSSDLRSRVRLALPTRTADFAGSSQVEKMLRRAVSRAVQGDTEQAIEEYKRAGVLMSEMLKARAGGHRRGLLMAHSLALPVNQRAAEIRRLLTSLKQTSETLHTLRELAQENAPQCQEVRALLDEYLSNYYVQYLSKVRSALAQVEPPPTERADSAEYRCAWEDFDGTLLNLQRSEAQYREKFSGRFEASSSPAEQENCVMRLSLLKKFFQSRMFVDVTWHSPSLRMVETTAVLGAAFAGLLWAVVQFLSVSDPLTTTSQGASFLVFAVLAYVLRDRIKERAKSSLHKRLQRVLPDTDRRLTAEGRGVGTVREWIRLLKRRDLSDPLRGLRQRSSQGEVDKDIPEDVLHLRKQLSVAASLGSGWALQENTRINVERYLKYMDDPMKEFAVLDPLGAFSSVRSRRVYYFHILLETRMSSLAIEGASFRQLYRVVLDKKGIDRVEVA